jgi:hypothetical protein
MLAVQGLGTTGVPYDQYCDQASLWDPIAWMTCLPHDVSKVFGGTSSSTLPPPPPPPPPNIALSTDPAAAATPGAIYAGTDASGNPVYAVPQTASANMAAYAAQVKQFMDDVGTANPPPDCTTTWNQLFNSACPSTGTSYLPWVLGGLATVLVLGMVLGGRK